ncbi:hypothetical protein HNQ07_002862 [Deinococcus metalli]|uniref:LPS-assembly protein LptD n=1 Tax=Deinococcus metalli TaxID=1141878 RepID=A0A7W8KG99_9DEIO|nr:hypothetical protein [Deinococcus metalli]MBB5377370.1 hypothetical protein [Deinococcus metalli]GHF49938.1 hypothetical protein GCM10017781_27980 [Deinococcus metalli]
MSGGVPGRPLGRRARKRAQSAALTLALLGLLGGAAGARTVRIVTADTLELRNVENQELVVIGGEMVELRVDDDVVRAKRVEFNRTKRTLTLVGQATYRSAKDGQVMTGENLVVDLGEEQVTGEDVLMSDADLEIRGAQIERIPGQLKATDGYFTTCARCGRTPNDYAFRAKRILMYPGDRLVAYDAQLLIADAPVLFLPVVVIPLNDADRQPRLLIGQGADDGVTVEADLPFSIGSSTLGTTLLRYYQNRNPSVGYGVSLRSYAPAPYVDRVNLYTLVSPRPFLNGVQQPGDDVDFVLGVTGRVPLESALKDLEYSLDVTRRDIGRSATDPDRGVTNVTFGAKVDYPLFTAEFNYVDRYGPAPTTPLPTPLKLPEVVVDPKPYTRGNLSTDFRFSAGRYMAQSNPLSPSATKQGINITTTRLEESHSIAFTAQPWKNADLSLTNTYTGRFYGTGARTVQLNLGATLTQRFNTTNTVQLSAGYTRNEGTSPFAFDAVTRLLSAPLGVTLQTVPVKDVRFGIQYRRDLFLSPTQQAPTTFTLDVTRLPVNVTSQLGYNFITKQLETFSYTVTLSDPQSNVLTYVPAQPAQPASSQGGAATPTTADAATAGDAPTASASPTTPATGTPAESTTTPPATTAPTTPPVTTQPAPTVPDPAVAAEPPAPATPTPAVEAPASSGGAPASTVPASTTPAGPVTAAEPARAAYYRRSSRWPAPNLTLTFTGGYSRATGYAPFTARATVTGDVRTNSFSVYATQDIQNQRLDNVGFSVNAAVTRDTVLNPLSVSATEALYLTTGRVAGTATVTWRNRYQLSATHDLLLTRPAAATDSGTVNFSVGTTGGSATSWQLTYGGRYDLVRGGFTQPTVSGSLSATRPGERLALSAVVNVPGLDQPRTELARADADLSWQFGSRAAISGRAVYTSFRNPADDKKNETLQLSPVRATVGIGRKGERPGAYVTVGLSQNFSWVDGVRQNPTPLAPVIGLTIDRCCWALQAEADLGLGRYRLAVGLPGQNAYPLFDLTGTGFEVPLLNTP